MKFLDIILDPKRIPERLPDTSRLPKPALPDSIPADTTDTVAKLNLPGGNMQLADVCPPPSNMIDFGDNLLTTILAVAAGLCLCFFFVRVYRQRK